MSIINSWIILTISGVPIPSVQLTLLASIRDCSHNISLNSLTIGKGETMDNTNAIHVRNIHLKYWMHLQKQAEKSPISNRTSVINIRAASGCRLSHKLTLLYIDYESIQRMRQYVKNRISLYSNNCTKCTIPHTFGLLYQKTFINVTCDISFWN